MLKLSRCFAANLWRESKPVSACFSQESDLVFLHPRRATSANKNRSLWLCERCHSSRQDLRNDEAAIGCLVLPSINAFNQNTDIPTTSKSVGFLYSLGVPAHPIGVLERGEANASFWIRATRPRPSSRDTAST